MYLKKLEVQGFKSFADKTIFEFQPGITAVIGPNGSGKSNVSDAIRWVLGEQRAKSLRGGKMEDVIFTGTQNRKALNFAEVTLVIDNSDGKLPVNFTEVAITRRIYRSGESEYYINKSTCRLKDIIEVFMGTGIGRDGYSIIGQGRIDEILSNNSEERRNVFEEAAGISKYKARKQESERKLEATCQNLLRINDVINELDSQVGPLKSQSEKAQQFLSFRDELKILEINLFIHDTEKLKTALSQIDEHIAELTQELNEKIKNSEVTVAKRNSVKGTLSTTSTEIDRLKDLLFEKQTLIEKIKSEMNLLSEKSSSHTANISRFESEISENQEKIQTLEEEKQNKLGKITRLEEQKKTYSSSLLEKETELAKIMKTLSDEELKIENIKSEMLELMDKKSDLKATMNSTLTMQGASSERHEHLREKLSNIASANDKLRMKFEDDSENISKLSGELKTISTEFQESKNEETRIEGNLKALENKLFSITTELNIKTTKHKFLSDTEKNNEGYFRSVKGILDECAINSSFKKGIHGTLTKLISVPQKFELAMEIALGSNLQNIVTDTQEDAKKAIEFLKINNLGRATFFPISSFDTQEEPKFVSKLSECHGYIGMASKLVECDKKCINILESLLGKTVIVETLADAIAMSKKVFGNYRIVSLEGDVVNTSGTMSGGSTKVKQDSLLSRGRVIGELEEEIKKLNKDLTEVKHEIEKANNELTGIKAVTTSISEKFREKEVFLAGEKEKLSSLEKEINLNDEKIKSIRSEQAQILDQDANFKNQITAIENQIKEYDERISSIQLAVNEYKTKNKEQMEIRDNLSLDITNLKISTSSFDESISSIQEMLERIDSDIANAKEFIEKRTALKKQLAEEIENFRNAKNGNGDNIKTVETEIATITQNLSNQETCRVSLLKELDEVEASMNDDALSLEETKAKISKEEMKKVKIDLDFENLNNKIWEDYQITYSAALELKQDLGSINKTSSQVNSLKSKIKELGSINIDSIEEYKKVSERFTFMTKQKDDLVESEQKLRKVITDMISIMKDEFINNFKIINENFKIVFAELFNGGTANIRLCDESNILESGIDIEVQPPGKKLQNMMLLSGGERALTAIALLFAILKINPSPFCVLDEIEAALDDVNVYRFADYVKKFSQKIQFVIITHRKGTMESADTVYGITMQEKGISKLVSMKLN